MLALLNFTHFVSSSGYLAVFALSILQSCCVPTSSELTLGFAGVLAAEGRLSLPGAVLAGVSGEVVGAYLAWMIGYYGGRAFVERYGRYVLMSTADLDRAEAWYSRHDRFGVFGSRLLPVIRNFVALPAGVAEVPLVRFGILTLLGSLLWDTAMALIGYEIGGSWREVMKGFSDAGYLLGALVALAVVVFLWHRWHSYHRDVSAGLAVAGEAGGRREPLRPTGRSAGRVAGRSSGRPAGETSERLAGQSPGRAAGQSPERLAADEAPGWSQRPPAAPAGPSRAPRAPRSLSDKAAEARARREHAEGPPARDGTDQAPG